METPTTPSDIRTQQDAQITKTKTQNILRGVVVSCQRHIAEEREKRQWVNHERGSAMADTDILTWKMAPFVSV